MMWMMLSMGRLGVSFVVENYDDDDHEDNTDDDDEVDDDDDGDEDDVKHGQAGCLLPS